MSQCTWPRCKAVDILCDREIECVKEEALARQDDAYKKGFSEAKRLAIEVWDTQGTGSLGEPAGHVYCEFFHVGRKLLEQLGEKSK